MICYVLSLFCSNLVLRRNVRRSHWENAKNFACAKAEAKGREEGLAEGRAEGEAKGKAEMAKSMKADGVPIETIAKYSGLSKEEIRTL